MPVSISDSAYLIAALHFAKYGHGDAVFGLLLGKQGTISEAIPLFHTYVLPTSLTVALAIVSEYAKASNLNIVGAYSKHSEALNLVLPTINDNLPKGEESVGLLFDEAKLQSDESMFLTINTKGEPVPLKAKDCSQKLQTLINEDIYIKIADFDEHLEDVSIDFLSNSALVC